MIPDDETGYDDAYLMEMYALYCRDKDAMLAAESAVDYPTNEEK